MKGNKTYFCLFFHFLKNQFDVMEEMLLNQTELALFLPLSLPTWGKPGLGSMNVEYSKAASTIHAYHQHSINPRDQNSEIAAIPWVDYLSPELFIITLYFGFLREEIKYIKRIKTYLFLQMIKDLGSVPQIFIDGCFCRTSCTRHRH